MTEIRNSNGKLVCRLDADKLIVEIVHKGIKSTIYIVPNSDPVVANETA